MNERFKRLLHKGLSNLEAGREESESALIGKERERDLERKERIETYESSSSASASSSWRAEASGLINREWFIDKMRLAVLDMRTNCN